MLVGLGVLSGPSLCSASPLRHICALPSDKTGSVVFLQVSRCVLPSVKSGNEVTWGGTTLGGRVEREEVDLCSRPLRGKGQVLRSGRRFQGYPAPYQPCGADTLLRLRAASPHMCSGMLMAGPASQHCEGCSPGSTWPWQAGPSEATAVTAVPAPSAMTLDMGHF